MSERFFVKAFFTRHDFFPIKTKYCLSLEEAELFAECFCEEGIYYSVFVSFYRSDDCEFGYINRCVGDSVNWVN